MYNFVCPKCGGRMLVKQWTHSYVTAQQEPWCFCTQCRYRAFAKKLA